MGSPLSYLPHNAQPPARPGGLWGEKAPPQYPFREQRARASQGLYPTPPSSLPYTYPIPITYPPSNLPYTPGYLPYTLPPTCYPPHHPPYTTSYQPTYPTPTLYLPARSRQLANSHRPPYISHQTTYPTPLLYYLTPTTIYLVLTAATQHICPPDYLPYTHHLLNTTKQPAHTPTTI